MSGDCPALKDLPKLEGTLKDELVKPHELKKTEVEERVVLPSAEDLKQEKAHESLLTSVEGFTPDKLKHVKTAEPVSGAELMSAELAIGSIPKFDKSKLKPAETHEKNPLPDTDAIKAEAEHLQFKDGIEHFNKEKLKKGETVEKNTLPTKEVIEQEKKA